jgi:hypothetical protein
MAEGELAGVQPDSARPIPAAEGNSGVQPMAHCPGSWLPPGWGGNGFGYVFINLQTQ